MTMPFHNPRRKLGRCCIAGPQNRPADPRQGFFGEESMIIVDHYGFSQTT